MSRILITILLCLGLAGLPAGAALAQGEAGPRDFAVKAGKLITMSGPDLEPGMLIVRGGKITDVGRDLEIPEGLPVVDASTRVVMPAFIEAHSQRGLDRTYETTADASFLRVTDALNMVSLEIEDARRNGITTLLVAPDDRAFLAGRAAIVRPQGISVDSAILKQDAALKLSLLPSPGTSRMGHQAKLRKILQDARREMDERASRARDERGEPDSSKEALQALLKDEMPAIVYCSSAEDVTSMLEIAREHAIHVLPVIAPAAWRAIPLLARNRLSVVIGPALETWERQPDGSLLHVPLAKLLSDAKVPFALVTDPYELGPQHPWFQAALAVRQGVPREEALAAVTRIPSRILGFGRSKGVLAKGADADLVILSADPLSGAAWVDESYARGARIYARDKDEKLRRLLRPGSGEPPLVTAEADHDEDEHAPDVAPAGSEEREKQERFPVPGLP